MSRTAYRVALFVLVVGWVPISVAVGIGVGHLFNNQPFGGFIGFSCWVGLFVPLIWIGRKAMPHLSGCPHCGYSIHKNESGVCPECGAAIEESEDSR